MTEHTAQQLVHTLQENGVLKSSKLRDAFLQIDRKDFIPAEFQEQAYSDYPLQIGYDQTISQPSTVAFMLELLDPKQGEKILDIGSGSGWTTALLAFLVGSKGKVFGVELVPKLVAFGAENLKKYNFPQAAILQAGKNLGLAKEAPFDKILVSAAAQDFPETLLSQLKEGGTLVIPVRDAIWSCKKLSQGKAEIKKFEGFAFVPLITS